MSGTILHYRTIDEATAESRKAAFACGVGDNRVLCRVLGRWRMYLDNRDNSYMPYLATDGIYSPHLLAQLCEVVKPGMTVADVGACFGYLSILAGELVGDHGNVMAFEPRSRSFHLLKQNVELNGLRGVVCASKLAVGAANGEAKLTNNRNRYAYSTLAEKATAASSNPEDVDTVSVITIDSLRTPPDFLIISTVGYEPQVWQGMRQTLNTKRHLGVLMEFTPKWYDDPEKFAASLLDDAFMAHRIHTDGRLERLTDPARFADCGKSDLLLTR